jgi:DNA polymerase I-like protein with 3'-5' exonuclease and polymerase domains
MQRTRAGEPSTSCDVLDDLLLQPGCPNIVRYIVDYRSNEKLIEFLEDIKSRLPRAWPFPATQMSQSGGPLLRMACNVQQTVTDTGRLAMDEPNLQVWFAALRMCRTALLC